MKSLKITVDKKISGGRTDYVYPDGYDSDLISVEGYEHGGDPSKLSQTEYLVGVADDLFPSGDGIVELDQVEYSALLAATKPAA